MGGRRFTDEEIEYIRKQAGRCLMSTMANSLNRSEHSIYLKMRRLGIGGILAETDMFTRESLSNMMGVNYNTVAKTWRKAGLKPIKKGRFNMYPQERVIDFLYNNQDLWNAARVSEHSILHAYDWFQEKKKKDVKKAYYWTPREVGRLKFLYRKGVSEREIAKELGKTRSSIRSKVHKIQKKEGYII